MEDRELLLTTNQSAQQFSVCLLDHHTRNTIKLYKNGGPVPRKCLSVLGEDYILAGEANKPLLHVWPLNSQEIDKNIRLILPGPATCLSLAPDNNYIAVGVDTKLYVWQLNSGKLLSVQQRHYQAISCIKFSSDGEYVAVGGDDGVLVVYFLADLVAIHHSLLGQTSIGQVEPVYSKNDHNLAISDMHLGTFGKNSSLATCSVDQTACLYTLSTGELLLSLVFDEPLTTVIFDSPCWNLYLGTGSGPIKQWNLTNPSRTLRHLPEKHQYNTFSGHKAKVVALALNCTNSLLASGAEDNLVYIWEVAGRDILQKLEYLSVITNLRFVPAFESFTKQTFKPKTVIKPLERNTEPDSDDFLVAKMQNEDLRFSDEEECGKVDSLQKENMKLRIVNGQLYRAALEISKKYNVSQ